MKLPLVSVLIYIYVCVCVCLTFVSIGFLRGVKKKKNMKLVSEINCRNKSGLYAFKKTRNLRGKKKKKGTLHFQRFNFWALFLQGLGPIYLHIQQLQ